MWGSESPGPEGNEMTSAVQVWSDLIDVCNAAQTCPHESLSHVTGAEGWSEAEDRLLLGIIEAAQIAGMDQRAGLEHAAHVLILAAAIGYSIGAGDAYSIAVTEEVTVPDTLAGVDFMGDE